MAQANDILLEKLPSGDFGDVRIENGDFVIGPSDNQHIADIVMSSPGWIKQFPLLGVDPYRYMNARRSAGMLNQAIKLQLQSDGYNVTEVAATFVDDKLDVKHNATRS